MAIILKTWLSTLCSYENEHVLQLEWEEQSPRGSPLINARKKVVEDSERGYTNRHEAHENSGLGLLPASLKNQPSGHKLPYH